MAQKNMAKTMIYVAPLVKWHKCYEYVYDKAENNDEIEVLCLKGMKDEPQFYFIYIFHYIEICH